MHVQGLLDREGRKLKTIHLAEVLNEWTKQQTKQLKTRKTRQNNRKFPSPISSADF